MTRIGTDDKLPKLVPDTGLYGTPRSSQQIQRDFGRMTDADAATRDAEMRQWRRDTLINQIPGPSAAQLAASSRTAMGPVSQMAQQMQAPRTAPAPTASPLTAAPSAPASDPLGPVSRMAQQMRVSNTSVPAIKRVDNAPGLKSPLFTNLDPTQAVSEMQGGTVNSMPAAAFQSAGPAASRELSAALQAAGARGDWDAVRTSYQQGGGTWQGETAQQSQDKALQAQAAELLSGKSRSGRQTGLGIIQQLAQAQQARDELAANQQQALQQREDGAAGRQLQQLQVDQAQQMFDLTQKALNGDAKAAAQLQQLSGKGNPMLDLFSKVAESYIRGAAQSVTEPPQFATLWGQIEPLLSQVSGGQQQPKAPSLATDPRAAAIRDNANLTRAQKVAALRELGYQ